MDKSTIENADNQTIYKLEVADHMSDSIRAPAIETMLIGFFSSLIACEEVEKDYRKLPGFSLPSCNFVKTPYHFSLNGALAIDRVYYVQSCVLDALNSEEDTFEVGLFLSKEEAEAARAHYLDQVILKSSQEQFEENTTIYINEYKINQRHWTEGFVQYTWFSDDP